MHMSIFSSLIGTVLLATLSQAQDSRGLPPCSIIDRPCKCPSGTTFKNLTTFGVIGAPAIEVQNIMGKFLNIEYQGGLVPSSTTGTEGVPGATRTFNFTGPDGPYQIGEQLVEYKAFRDGSFIQKAQQNPRTPVVQVPGAGTYYGLWYHIIGEQTLIGNETVVAWKNWRCETGVTFPAAKSHEGGIVNASAVITTAGKHTGVDITPFTIFYEVRDD